MTDDIFYNTRIYTDIQGIERLRYDQNQSRAKKEIAQQFEALMIQMVLRSMRDATNAFSSGLFSNKQMEIYEDMFDKQLSLMMSNNNIGFAKTIEDNIDQMMVAKQEQPQQYTYVSKNNIKDKSTAITSITDKVLENKTSEPAYESQQAIFPSPEDFVRKLWSMAKTAANYIGAKPEVLIAQAALETNWGKNILGRGGASHNLFNIKADTDWDKKVTVVNAIEYKNGILVKENAKFKNYDSYIESFMDYINLLKGNVRYNDALNKASDPEQFVRALHNAGYATDPKYGEKILKIFSSHMFKNIIGKVKSI